MILKFPFWDFFTPKIKIYNINIAGHFRFVGLPLNFQNYTIFRLLCIFFLRVREITTFITKAINFGDVINKAKWFLRAVSWKPSFKLDRNLRVIFVLQLTYVAYGYHLSLSMHVVNYSQWWRPCSIFYLYTWAYPNAQNDLNFHL